jgi:DNA-binding response OmpR family regulator
VHLIVMSDSPAPSPALEALEVLGHDLERRPLAAPASLGSAEAVIVDASGSLLTAKNAVVQLAATTDVPRLVLLSEHGFAAVNATWPAHEFILSSAQPAELEARLRLATARAARTAAVTAEPGHLKEAGVEIDEGTYTARVHGKALNLTYKEFELLKFLAGSPDHVFTREQLLAEVWGYDYFGGTRTVDVHVRRLRAKLGSDYEGLIRTVRNVGYLFAKTSLPAD